MSADDSPNLSPQQATILLLGELRGQMAALTSLVSNSQAAQADVNTAHEQEHAAMRSDIATLSTGLALVQAQQPKRAPWYSIVAGVVGIISGIASLITLLAILYRIAPAI